MTRAIIYLSRNRMLTVGHAHVHSECMKYACSYPDMSAKVHAHMLARAAHASTYYDPYLFKACVNMYTHMHSHIACA